MAHASRTEILSSVSSTKPSEREAWFTCLFHNLKGNTAGHLGLRGWFFEEEEYTFEPYNGLVLHYRNRFSGRLARVEVCQTSSELELAAFTELASKLFGCEADFRDVMRQAVYLAREANGGPSAAEQRAEHKALLQEMVVARAKSEVVA